MAETAAHYLRVYRGRIDMASRGIISPHPHVLHEAKLLIKALEALDGNQVVELKEIDGARAAFAVAGRIIATFTPTPND